ncbi:hypothetical protein [Anaerovibrio sp. RM50]|uniref:hypothetical protein n=1 Tax=Anaerovibrio sp. RM50 TaxID=1200557 RepID=UPI0004819153|nr:hypothetical protein [Anaerovibrio sp. RM50]
MIIIFLFLRFFYHILPKTSSHNNLICEVKTDFINLYAYAKQIFTSNTKKVKIILTLMAALLVLELLPFNYVLLNIFEEFLSTVMFFLLVNVFLPMKNPPSKGFPVEIFGFIYSVIFMFYSTGALVFQTLDEIDFFREDIWIYGYCVTVLSYIICIATLQRFMERDLLPQEIILLGMIMLSTLEFITYYGVGFFSGLKWYDPSVFEANIFGDFTSIINQGIFVASQSQILERNPMEIWGYVILNGTDVLTVTVVLGYVFQKIFVNSTNN